MTFRPSLAHTAVQPTLPGSLVQGGVSVLKESDDITRTADWLWLSTLFCSDTRHLALIRILMTPAWPYLAAVWKGVSPYCNMKGQNKVRTAETTHVILHVRSAAVEHHSAAVGIPGARFISVPTTPGASGTQRIWSQAALTASSSVVSRSR